MDHQTEQALNNLLTGIASAEDIELLKQKLANGQVSIGGNVNQSVIILGSGNTVQLTPGALEALNGRSLLGDLERDLTGTEIQTGLTRLAELLPDRAPILKPELDKLAHRLRPTLQTDQRALSSEARSERTETLAHVNSLCLEVTEIAFSALCTGVEPPAYDSRSPFRGLESFRPEDAEYFFGREALTKKLVQKLNEHNFLAVLGASGSGKSSLVMAGLIPALNLPYAIFRPGAEPLVELEKALQGNPALLVVDQFEELFTLSAREQRTGFISRLLEQSQKIRVVITMRSDFLGEVASQRQLNDEIQKHLENIPPMNETELLQAMEGQASCAGLRFESDLSQQMLDDVSDEPGAMPLLQHALWMLWMRRHGRWLRAEEYRAFGGVKQAIASTAETVYKRCIEFERERLHDIFLRLTRLDEGTDGRDTRRRILLHNLVPTDGDPVSTKLLIKQLADARLVVISSVGQETKAEHSTLSTGLPTTAAAIEVEVAHEALIRHWKRLRGWLNDDRDNLRLCEGISDDARRWENASRDESLLNHRGARLELALAMSKNPRYRLNLIERAYLEGCVDLREREKTAAAKQRRYTIAGVSVALVVIMAILAGWGWTSNENSKQLGYQVATATYAQGFAEQQARISRARELSAISITIPDSLPRRRLLLAVEALNTLKRSDPHLLDLEANLRKYLGDFAVPPQASAQDAQWITTPSAPNTFMSLNGRWQAKLTDDSIILSETKISGASTISLKIGKSETRVPLAISDDGQWLAIADNTNANLWDTKNQSRIPLLEHENGVTAIAFSPDKRWLVTGTYYGVLRVWDLKNLKPFEPGQLTYKDGDPNGPPIYTLAFSPDGRWLGVGSEGAGTNMAGADDRVQIWDLNNLDSGRRFLESVDGSANGVYVSFSSNGKWLANGGAENTVGVWDVQDSFSHLITLRGYENGIRSVKFSSDGNRLAIEDAYGVARVLDMHTRDLLTEPLAFYRYESSALHRPGYYETINRRWIIAKASNDPLQIWDLENPKSGPIKLSESSSLDIAEVMASPDMHWLVSRGGDDVITLWDLQNPDSHPFELSRAVSVDYLAFYPSGQYLTAILHDYSLDTTRIIKWDLQDLLSKPVVVKELQGSLNVQIISPSKRFLVSLDDNGSAFLWDMVEPAVEPNKLSDYGTETWFSAAFSSDELWFAKGNLNGVVKIWDLQNLGHSTFLTYRTKIEDVVVHLDFSPDDRWLAIGIGGASDFELEALNIQDPSHNKQAEGLVTTYQFSSKGGWLAAGNDQGMVYTWDLQESAANPVYLQGHETTIDQLDFSPDGRWLAASIRARPGDSLRLSQGGHVLLWDLLDPGSEALKINGDSPLMFSQDNRFLLTGYEYPDYSSALQLWHIGLDEVEQVACEIVGRNFTSSEWQLYFAGEKPRATCDQWPIAPEPTPVPTP